MKSGRSKPELLAGGFAFLEGPRWHEGTLYVSDFYTHLVQQVDSDGRIRAVCEVPGRPSGLGFTPDGSLLVVSMRDRRLLRLVDGRLVEYADLKHLAPADLNDMVVDEGGRAYVGNFGSENPIEMAVRPTRLICVEPDGVARHVGEELLFPNGCALSGDGRTLLVAESFAARVSAFDVGETGELSGRRTWAQFELPPTKACLAGAIAEGAVVPDGIALDGDGALWLADAGGGTVIRIAQGGEVLDVVELDGLTAYAVALGGDDLRTLYICAAPSLLAYDPDSERNSVLLVLKVDVPANPRAR